MGNTYNRVYIWCCKYGENRYCERCANKKICASKHTGLLNSCLGKLCLDPYLVVPLISARVTLISTRVSAHCQAILLLFMHFSLFRVIQYRAPWQNSCLNGFTLYGYICYKKDKKFQRDFQFNRDMKMPSAWLALCEVNHISRRWISITKGHLGEARTLLLLSWTSRWTNSRVVGNLRRHDAHVTSL